MWIDMRLHGTPRPDAEHVFFFYPVLLVRKRSIQGSDRKRVAPGTLVQVWFQRGIKGPQSTVIQVIQEIPEQAEVKPCSFWKTK